MRRKPTMTDVARHAGVSIATVSRVLNGGRVSDRYRNAVQEAIRSLGYRPNRLARGLVTGHTGVVGVVVPDILGPLYASMARGIEERLAERGMVPLVTTDNRDEDMELHTIDLLLTRQVEGLVLIGSRLGDEALNRIAREVPLTLVQRESDGDALPGIALDNAHGVELALDHLTAAGHRHIAYVGGIRRDGRERLAAFERALQRRGLRSGPVLEADFSEEGGVAAGRRLLELDGATAALCANDRMAVGVYHTLATRGLRVPDRLSIVGFDDLPWGRYLDPPLTTIRQPAREMGRLAVERLFQSPAGGAAAAATGAAPPLVRPELVARASVGPPARSAQGR